MQRSDSIKATANVEQSGATAHWKEFVCGGGAACCNVLVTYPLNKIVFRQMMHGIEPVSAIKQLKREGIFTLYRGMLPPLLQRSMSMSFMFGIYDECLQPLLRYQVNPYLAKTIAGLLAGTVEASLMPFERVQTLLVHQKYDKQLKNTFHGLAYIYRHYGIKEFYRGFRPILARNGPSNSMYFIIRDEARIKVPKQENAFYQGLQNFLIGATTGAFLSTLFYPINVIKIVMQIELGGPHRTITWQFRELMKQRGYSIGNLFHGVSLNISRSFISWGVINSSYEIFRKFVYD